MIHTCQLEQICYLVDKHGPQIMVHSYKLVIFDFEKRHEISKEKRDLSLY